MHSAVRVRPSGFALLFSDARLKACFWPPAAQEFPRPFLTAKAIDLVLHSMRLLMLCRHPVQHSSSHINVRCFLCGAGLAPDHAYRLPPAAPARPETGTFRRAPDAAEQRSAEHQKTSPKSDSTHPAHIDKPGRHSPNARSPHRCWLLGCFFRLWAERGNQWAQALPSLISLRAGPLTYPPTSTAAVRP